LRLFVLIFLKNNSLKFPTLWLDQEYLKIRLWCLHTVGRLSLKGCSVFPDLMSFQTLLARIPQIWFLWTHKHAGTLPGFWTSCLFSCLQTFQVGNSMA